VSARWSRKGSVVPFAVDGQAQATDVPAEGTYGVTFSLPGGGGVGLGAGKMVSDRTNFGKE